MAIAVMQQNPAQAAPAAPAAPAPPQATVVSNPLDQLTYRQLRARQSELQDQRSQLATRRLDVANRYERATGANKAGIGERLAVMDNSMVQIESDLAAVGHAMVAKRSTSTGNPFVFGGGDTGGVNPLGFLIPMVAMVAVVIIISRNSMRRAKRQWQQQMGHSGPTVAAGNERLDRIEQAVDAIAIEIERVSENQRFMTRLMTETQLAGSLAAVRGSAELAKAAADEKKAAG